MRKKKAIKILRLQKEKVSSNSAARTNVWVFQTASFIKSFFGENSTEFSFISQFSFTIISDRNLTSDEFRRRLDTKTYEIVNFIDTCIETINHTGLYKNPNNGPSVNSKVWKIIVDCSAILGVIGTVLFAYLSYNENKKSDNLEKSLNKIRDSLRVVQPSIITKTVTPKKK